MTQFIKCITIEKKYCVLSKGPVFVGRVNLSIEFNKTRTVSRLNRYANTQLSLPILNIEALHNAIAFELWSACFHLFHCSRFHLTRNNVIALSLSYNVSPLLAILPRLCKGITFFPNFIADIIDSQALSCIYTDPIRWNVSMILWTNITREMHAKKSKKKKKKILPSIYIYKKIKKFFIERVMKMFVNNLYSV